MLRLLGCVCCLLPALGFGQSAGESCKYIMASRSEVALDSLSVIPGSIYIKSNENVDYHYDLNTGLIYFDVLQPMDSVLICFQTIPFPLHKTYQRKSLAEYQAQITPSVQYQKKVPSIIDRKEELFPTDNLQKSGSLSRGISFGNTQNVVVNSALNLQLEGKLGDDLNIRASITDQNVPFQPEGNTAQIQDFDNIFLELYNDNFSLKGGDVVFKNKNSEFLRYHKNVQGGLLNTRYKMGSKSMAETSLGVSVAKGKFASIDLQVEEGVAGPYRIKIPNTNDFIIILANSESVFLDGKKLQRGFNFDYIIDYNKAEIQFTSKVLITKYSRVRIDVEYSDQNYSRSIITGSQYQQMGKASFSFNYYSEKDNPNKPLTIGLNSDDRSLMKSIGDDLDKAVKVSAQRTPYNVDEVLYKLVDTLDNALNFIQVFRYSANPEDSLYRVSFSEVGDEKGDYILTNSTTNGRIYAWVSPVNEVPQGNYAPLVRIPAPNRKDMVTLGGEVELSKYEKVFTEVAFSKNNLNLFSGLDSEDDNGFAVKSGLKSMNRPVSFLKDYLFSAFTNYEFDNAFFNPIDRYRYVEFDRDWNYDVESKDQSADHILQVEMGVKKDALNMLGYKMVKRKRADYVDGIQHYFDFAQGIGPFQIVSDAFILRNTTNTFHSKWERLNAQIAYKSKVFVPGYKFSIDENEMRALDSDSIISSAMNFREHKFFINSNDSLATKFGLSYSLREDKRPITGELKNSDQSETTQFFINSSLNPNQKLNFLLTYRNNTNYQVADEPKREETLMVRTDWYAGFLNRHIRSDLTYSIGSGRELKREFVYVQVPTGEGTHTWRDDNGNGIQELNEFYIAINPDEKNYIKIFVPTNDYIFAYENNFNYRLNLEMPRNWKKSDGIKKMLSRFSGTASWNSIKRITATDLASRILPFYAKIPESEILSLKETIRSRIFYNRASPGLGMDFGYFQSANKQLMSQGFESRNRSEYSANARLNLSKSHSMKLLYLWGTSGSKSDFLQGRNFGIYRYKIVPELAWQPGTNLRLSLMYGYSDKVNRESDMTEEAKIHEITGNLKVSKAADLSLDANLKLSEIQYSGETNTSVAYEMLEALQPGRNYTWNLIIQKKILMGLQLSMSYEGRKSSNIQAIHIGRMQVNALF